MVATPTGEEVQATRRRSMTKRRKAIIHAFHDGKCWKCDAYVASDIAEYDHRIPVWMGGEDDDGPNAAPLHPWCHTEKTAKDATDRAKVKRQKAPKKKSGWFKKRQRKARHG